MKSIEVTISPEGDINIEAIGYRGKSCEEATRHLEMALGQVQERKLKPEYALETELVSATH